MNKPKAVLLSDIHFTPTNLELASSALIHAVKMASSLNIPLIIAGDLLDSKAIIRAECANKLIQIFDEARKIIRILIIPGNHDMCNEKSLDHSLNFLYPYSDIIDGTRYDFDLKLWLISYQSNSEKLKDILHEIPHNSTIICHQGVLGADMGHYILDKSSLPKECFKNFRVISGHYHKAQDIQCSKYPADNQVGVFSYIGSPFTHSFSEANDGAKGFRVLYEDGTLELIPTKLRSHHVLERTTAEINNMVERTTKHGIDDISSGFFGQIAKDDLVWLKITGPQSELDKLDKKVLGDRLFGHSNYKLDKIPTDSSQVADTEVNLTDQQVLDTIIDSKAESEEYKKYLKDLWRSLLNETFKG